MIAASSGGAGDIIYSLKVMRALKVRTLYVKQSFYDKGEGDLYSNIKPLIEYNEIRVLPTVGGAEPMFFDPELKFDFNLDMFRMMPERNRVHIIINQYLSQGLPFPDDYKQPWLILPDQTPLIDFFGPDVTLFNVTQRWRGDMKVNWRKIVDYVEGPKKFIGLKVDHLLFQEEIGCAIDFLPTTDFLEGALAIRDAKTFVCNQSWGLTVAQGIGREYWCGFKTGKSNTKMFTANEHELL